MVEGESVVVRAVGPHSLACLRSLKPRSVHTIAIHEESSTQVFRSRYCDEKLICPSPAESLGAYKDALVALASRDDVRTIIPVREEDVYVLSRYRSEFEEHLRPLWPRFETVRTVHDRMRLVSTAKMAGVSVPETATLDDIDQWDRERIVKARYPIRTEDYLGSDPPKRPISPTGVYYLEPGKEPDREAILAEMDHVPIVQEYIPGEEYALWALYDRGDPVATCQKHQIRARSYVGGTSAYRKTTHIPELEDAGRALLDHLDWHGLASIQFKRDTDTGEFTLMEINPRAWVSLPCPVRAGVDFPYYYWRLAGGGTVPTGEECVLDVGTHELPGEAKYLLSVLREENPFVEPPSIPTALWEVGSSLCTEPRFDYLTLDDPRPFAYLLRKFVHTVRE